jgi:hypothetical protein
MTAPHPDVVNWNEIDGTPGNPDYTTGPPGPTGPAGPQGPIGPPGTNGQAGIQGNQGIPGAGWKVQQISPTDGANTGDPLGTIWYNSVTGQFWTLTSTTPYTWRLDGTVVGAQGNTGPQGPAGPQGVPGATGNTGPAGPQGIQGNPGPQGIQGPGGPQGPIGNTGATGSAGPAGTQGPVGPSSSVHEEFMPGNGATTVTLSQTPQWILMVARAGVVQSQTDGNYSLSASTITFTDAFNGAERVIVDYASTGYTPVPPISGAGIADGSITSLQIQDGAIATADLANQSVTNIKLGTDTARANLLANAGFEIWQRGFGPFTASTAYSADRWQLSVGGAGASLSVAGDSGNVDSIGNSKFSAAATVAIGSGFANLSQKIEDFAQLRGTTVTFSVRVRTSTAGAVQAAIQINASTNTLGTIHSGNGTWQTLNVTLAVPNNITSIGVFLIFNAACTAYIDNAMLVVGSVPADYAPLHPADDLARCLRYYEALGFASGFFVRQFVATANGQNDTIWHTLRVRKAVVPTVTRVGTWTLSGITAQPSAGAGNPDGFYLVAQANAAGNPYYQCADATTGITAEANP